MAPPRGAAIYKLILALIYVISTLLLVVKVLSPTSVQVVVHGEGEVYVREVTNVYSLSDVVVIVLSTALMTLSGVLLVLPAKPAPLALRAAISGASLSELSEGERRVYDLLVRMGGVAFQSDIVRRSGMSRSTVSVILDKLEARGLVVKRRRGLRNLVVLRQPRAASAPPHSRLGRGQSPVAARDA